MLTATIPSLAHCRLFVVFAFFRAYAHSRHACSVRTLLLFNFCRGYTAVVDLFLACHRPTILGAIQLFRTQGVLLCSAFFLSGYSGRVVGASCTHRITTPTTPDDTRPNNVSVASCMLVFVLCFLQRYLLHHCCHPSPTRVFYLDDFQDVLEGIDPSYYLMIDTIVASQGRWGFRCGAERFVLCGRAKHYCDDFNPSPSTMVIARLGGLSFIVCYFLTTIIDTHACRTITTSCIYHHELHDPLDLRPRISSSVTSRHPPPSPSPNGIAGRSLGRGEAPSRGTSRDSGATTASRRSSRGTSGTRASSSTSPNRSLR